MNIQSFLRKNSNQTMIIKLVSNSKSTLLDKLRKIYICIFKMSITYFIKYSIFRCLRLKFKHPRNSDEIITKLFKPTKPCHKNYPRIFSLLYPLAIKCGKCVYIDLDDSFLFSHKYSTLLERPRGQKRQISY